MPTEKGLFITGTDTDVGKTEVTLGIMAAMAAMGRTVVGMKPVASGCESTAEGLRNADALRIQAAGLLAVDYDLVNPYAFQPAVAPHLAAAMASTEIRFLPIVDRFRQLAEAAEVVVEGVGGWRVPLGPDGEVASLAAVLKLPVVLVVGMRLGCINHALLTVESIERSGMRLAGWVANTIDPAMALYTENLASLRERIAAPFLGAVPYLDPPTPRAVAASLDLSALS